MPTYAYACSACEHAFDIRQSFSDLPLTTCPQCERESLRKLFSPVGVVFKGSGFYRNDSRAAKGKEPSATKGATSGEGTAGKDATGAAEKASTNAATAGATSGSGSGSGTATPSAPGGGGATSAPPAGA